MTKTNYFLALTLTAASITSAYASMEGQGSSDQAAMSHSSTAPEHMSQGQSTGETTAEYVISGNDFTLTPGKDNTHKIQLKSSFVTYKPHHDKKTVSNRDFSKLWSSNGQFTQASPSATIVWQKGPDLYEANVTITGASRKGKDLTFTVDQTAEGSILKNGQSISKDEFLSAASEGGKQNVEIWLNESPLEPTAGTGSHAGTHVGVGEGADHEGMSETTAP